MRDSALFITTKNMDYLRNTQEIYLLREKYSTVDIIGSQAGNYFMRLLKVYTQLIFRDCSRYDLVFVGFSPQLIVPLFSFKFKKTKLSIDFFISVYDTMVCDRKKFKNGSLIARFCRWLDSFTLKKADHIISDTNAHGDYFSQEFGIERDRISTLYLVADTNIYYPRPQKKPETIKDKYVVIYFGSVLPVQGVDVLLDALCPLKDDPEYYFYIVGPIKGKYEMPVGESIEYISWLPQVELAEYISRADLCLAGHFNAKNGKAKRTIPTKAFIYDMMNKPMILGDGPANHELFLETPGKYEYITMGDPVALTEKICDMKRRTYEGGIC